MHKHDDCWEDAKDSMKDGAERKQKAQGNFVVLTLCFLITW